MNRTITISLIVILLIIIYSPKISKLKTLFITSPKSNNSSSLLSNPKGSSIANPKGSSSAVPGTKFKLSKNEIQSSNGNTIFVDKL